MRVFLVAAFVMGACKGEPAAPSSQAPPPAKKTPAKKKPVDPGIARPGPGTKLAKPFELRGAANRLADVIKPQVSRAEEPWLLVHGLLAFGKDLKTADGKKAIDVIVGKYLEDRVVDGKVAYRSFPRKLGDTPVEPHLNLMAKTMLAVGVPLEYTFKRKQGDVTLGQLVADAKRLTDVPTNDGTWRDFAWTVDALLLAQGVDGKADPKLQKLALATVHRVEQEQQFLVPFLEKGRPDQVQKRKQGIFGHTCGGLHFVQAGIRSSMYLKDPNVEAIMKQQIALVLFRWDAERRMYGAYLEKGDPVASVLIPIQQLKFFGHVLETLALAVEAGLLDPKDPDVILAVQRVGADLVDTVNRIEPLYEKLGPLKEARRQSYYDLVGDACHAVNGLRKSLVAFFPSPPGGAEKK